MSSFLERLRVALGSDYDQMDELASGGMGVVYRARDRALDRLVAIKIIRPDLATAAASERFLREARILASFSHPNIVPVHRAGDAGGISYYVMDLLEGETLAQRLRRGPLAADEALRLAADLLGALDLVHAHGVVHRDVKPSNIFLTGGTGSGTGGYRAVLGDFGISKSSSPDQSALTASGHVVGTPGYMPPEQLAGGDVTARTDVCAAGMVLFEACTGRPWNFDSHSDQADWSGVPLSAVPALQRALAWSPAERWATAGEFARALGGLAPPRRRVLGGAIAAAALVAATALVVKGCPPATATGAALRVAVQPFSVDGPADGLGDSIAAQLVSALPAPADVDFLLAADRRSRGADIDVRGLVTRQGNGMRIQLLARGAGERFDFSATGARAAVVDTLARLLLLRVWQTRDTSFGDLPVGALPRSPLGMGLWANAEARYARGQWGAAEQAYQHAVKVDPTCALCELRLMIISRWLLRPADAALTGRVLAAVTAFTPRYQRVIRAGVNTTDRWAALDSMVASAPRFDLALFVYGDELFHRGPLVGRRRGDAIKYFRQVTDLRPRFVPAWEHLAWAAIPDGDSAIADSALRTYIALGASDDPETVVAQAVLTVGFAWRFRSTDSAVATTSNVLANPMIAGYEDLPLGARYLLVFDAPAGVVWLGERFLKWPTRPELRTPGLVAQIVGLLALGRADSARAVTLLLRGESLDPEYTLIAAEFEAARVLFDSLDARAAWPRIDSLLAPLAREGAGSPAQRRRAAWMLTLMARRAGAPDEARRWRDHVTGEAAPRPFAALLDADSIARQDLAGAVRSSKPLLALDSAGGAGDPFFRSALHLMRAQWQVDAGDLTAAIRTLNWHENFDLVGHFLVGQVAGVMEAADADWAFGTIGRWYRARLLERAGMLGREACDAYAGAARLWAQGDPVFHARAVLAREAWTRLRCEGTR